MEVLEKIAAIIPTFFYDVIARIVPGCAAIVLFLLARYGLHDSTLSILEGTERIFLFIGGGYVVGLVLTGISWLLCVATWNAFTVHLYQWVGLIGKGECTALLDRTHKDFANPLGVAARFYRQLFSTIDRLERKDPPDASAAATLAKMDAESTLSDNLLVAYLIAVAVWRQGGGDASAHSIPIAGTAAVLLANSILRRAVLAHRLCGFLPHGALATRQAPRPDAAA